MKSRSPAQRRGKIVVLTALLLPALLGMAAFGIDIGYIEFSRSRLQAASEAAALAAVQELPNGGTAVTKAQDLGQLNFADQYPNVVATGDVEFGSWRNGTFTITSAANANSVRVTAQLSEQNGNSLALFFARILGTSTSNIVASAIAAKPAIGTRFLMDEDMFDKDVPSIENLANSLGRDPESLVTARGFNYGKTYGSASWTWNDNFLDIPAGSLLTLPTGQATNYSNNDAGLFDIDHESFPFTDEVPFKKFLFYSETGNDPTKWGTDTASVLSQLDPLPGAAPVTNGGQYASFVNPNFIHVSPVFKSDINTLQASGGVPRVNAKGLRRGLLAYKIKAVGADIDGGGSVLPQLQIEIVDPSSVTLDEVDHVGTATYRIVQ